MTSLDIAQTIADQIGSRAFYMMGTRHKLGDKTSLIFDIRGCPKWNKIRVTLTPLDTYRVEFIRLRGFEVRDRLEVSDVYTDQLHAVIERHTGLALSL